MFGDTIKTIIVTLVISKAVRAFGEQDMADIIKGTGICICGIQLVLMLKPLQPGVEKSVGAVEHILGLLKAIADSAGKMLPTRP